MHDPGRTESQFVEVLGGQLWAESAGVGDTVLLIHSGITDSGMWNGQLAALAESRRVVRYDMRGFGRSTAVGGPFSHVDDLATVIAAMEVERPAVIAASMGARVAVDLALRDAVAIERMLLVGPALSGARFEDPRLRECWKLMSEAWEAGDKEQVIDIETEFWINGPGRPEGGADEAVIEQVRSMQRRILELLPDDEDDPEIEESLVAVERLNELAMPILVIVGEHDVSDIHRNADLIRTAVPNAEVVVIANSGHLPNMESVDEFNQLALEFLAPEIDQ